MFGKKPKFLIFGVLLMGLFLGQSALLRAAVKDTDLDGLTDEAELHVYSTDPSNADTDGDGVLDGQEIVDQTNPLDPNDSLPQQLDHKIGNPLPHAESLAWYFGRASGIFAFILLTVVVANGLLISTRLVANYVQPAFNYEMHRYFSWLALFAVLGHVASFTFDPFIRLTWAEGFLPFLIDRKMISALGYHFRVPVSLGIFALYGIIVLVITSHYRSKMSLRAWRITHYLSFLTYLLFLGHGIYSGTDTKEWWMIWIYSFSVLIVSLLVVVRIRKSIKDRRAKALQPQPTEPTTPRDPFEGLTQPRETPSFRKIV